MGAHLKNVNGGSSKEIESFLGLYILLLLQLWFFECLNKVCDRNVVREFVFNFFREKEETPPRRFVIVYLLVFLSHSFPEFKDKIFVHFVQERRRRNIRHEYYVCSYLQVTTPSFPNT